jgi:hypothetical protein
MGMVVRHTKFPPHHLGDAFARPELAAKSIGGGTTAQQGGQLRERLGGQPAGGAGWWPTAHGLGPPRADALHPLTDGGFADVQRFGNLTLGPALLLEAPSLEPSGFFPAVRYRVHT